MIKVRLQIGSGQILDTEEAYGLVYLDSDKRVGPDSKGFESTSYPEQDGENILPKTVDAPFDYTVKFFIRADSVKNANSKIAEFNALLYTQAQDSDVKEYKQVTFYNDYKRHKIVGYPMPISEATDFWRDRTNQALDVVCVEWVIRVNRPKLCDFNI